MMFDVVFHPDVTNHKKVEWHPFLRTSFVRYHGTAVAEPLGVRDSDTETQLIVRLLPGPRITHYPPDSLVVYPTVIKTDEGWRVMAAEIERRT